jgi:hypothetical protein
VREIVCADIGGHVSDEVRDRARDDVAGDVRVHDAWGAAHVRGNDR